MSIAWSWPFAFTYPLIKRVSYLPQYYLGIFIAAGVFFGYR